MVDTLFRSYDGFITSEYDVMICTSPIRKYGRSHPNLARSKNDPKIPGGNGNGNENGNETL